jgi:membrane protein implicated in regulation of membrane protease activity
MAEMLFVGVFVFPLILILILASFPTLIVAGLAVFAAGVYTLVVHPQWSPIWLFCFFWATGFWVVGGGIYEEFLKNREQRKTSSDVGPSAEQEEAAQVGYRLL